MDIGSRQSGDGNRNSVRNESSTFTSAAVKSMVIHISKPLPDNLRSQVDTLHKQGDAFRDVGDDLSALAAYKQAYDLIPDARIEWSPGCWLLNEMGDLLFRLGNYEEAAQCYVTQMPINDDSATLHWCLGRCFFKMNKLTSATKHFSIAVQLHGIQILENLEPECLAHVHATCPRPVGGWNDEIYEFEPWIDLALLREKLRDASRMAIKCLATECSGQAVYGFALCAFGDGFVHTFDFFPSASTEVNHQSRLTMHSDLNLRWSPFDWEHERLGAESFAEVGDFLRFAYEREPQFQEFNMSLSLFKGDVLSQMVLALHDLVGEGLFSQFNGVTVFCAQPESDGWLERYSGLLLNGDSLDNSFRDEFSWPGLKYYGTDLTFRRFRKRLRHSGEFSDAWHEDE